MAMYMNKDRATLVKGPSKTAIHAAHAGAFEGLCAAFDTDDKRTYFIRIVSLAHEDSSGTSFNFSGAATGPVPINHTFTGNFDVSGYFNTASGKGYIDIEYMTADDKE